MTQKRYMHGPEFDMFQTVRLSNEERAALKSLKESPRKPPKRAMVRARRKSK